MVQSVRRGAGQQALFGQKLGQRNSAEAPTQAP